MTSQAPLNNVVGITPDATNAVDFLRAVYPEGLWVLSAIDPDTKRIDTATFSATSATDCLGWIGRYVGTRNLYWLVNQPVRSLAKAAEREDIRTVDMFQVDIDPRPGEDPEAERERAVRKLHAFSPRPSAIIDSGGGIQAFWFLDEPIQINGDVAAAENAKLYNKALEIAFGADNCHNVNRIMRLPGTLNIPDERKRRKARGRRITALLEMSGDSYPIGLFRTAPKVDVEPGARVTVDLSASSEVDSVDDLPANVPDWVKVLIVQGRDPDDPDKYPSRSEAVFAVCCALKRSGVDANTIFRVITTKHFRISESVLEKKDPLKDARRQVEQAFLKNPDPLILDVNDPRPSARIFGDGKRPHLRNYNSEYLDYQDGAYRSLDDKTLDAELWEFLGKASRVSKAGSLQPFKPKKSNVAEVLAALRAQAHLDRDDHEPPCWLDGRSLPNPLEIVSFQNGLLHLPTRQLLPMTPDFFTRNALEFDYTHDAPAPTRFLRFLEEVWPSDPASVASLQEWFGYLIAQDTSQQKILGLFGPPRSGKGTIGHVLWRLVGKRNICAPTLGALGTEFGLQPLIGKQVALISDMRLGNRADPASIAEALLRISGEDQVTVNRKNREHWTGRLSTRFVIMSNELPRIKDESGALTKRFIALQMRETFYGKEDPGLSDRLMEELPGIMLWALDGWSRLKERGYFQEPATSAEAKEQLQALGSPIQAFVKDDCVLESGAVTSKDELFSAWRLWCLDSNQHPGTKQVFSSSLLAAFPGGIRVSKPRQDGVRTPCYEGISVRLRRLSSASPDVPF